MNRRKLQSKRHKFIKQRNFSQRNNLFINRLKKDIKKEEKLTEKINEKIEELQNDRFPITKNNKQMKVLKQEKLKNKMKVKSLRDMIDEEEKKVELIDKEEEKQNKIDKEVSIRSMIDKLEDMDLSDLSDSDVE